MKVHCLGTTGFHPSPTRHTACYYLPELSLVLDAGTGIFRLVQHLLEDPKSELTILLSHAHLDHVVGLTFLVDALAVTSLEHIRLIGDPEKLEAVKTHLYNELLFPVEPSMQFVELPLDSNGSCSHGSMELEGFEIDWFPLEHPGGSLGYCIRTADKKLAYVTDTVARPNADYLPWIKNADLLLHECYFGDEHEKLAEKTGHSWLSAVEDVVRQVTPKQVGLIHINPLAEMLKSDLPLTEVQRNELRMKLATDEMVFEY